MHSLISDAALLPDPSSSFSINSPSLHCPSQSVSSLSLPSSPPRHRRSRPFSSPSSPLTLPPHAPPPPSPSPNDGPLRAYPILTTGKDRQNRPLELSESLNIPIIAHAIDRPFDLASSLPVPILMVAYDLSPRVVSSTGLSRSSLGHGHGHDHDHYACTVPS